MMIVRLEPRGDGRRIVVVSDDGEVVREYDVTTSLPANVGVQIYGEKSTRDAIVAACDRAFGGEGCPCGKKPASACDGDQCREELPLLANPVPSMKIVTIDKLESTDGMMIAAKHLNERRPGTPGQLLDYVPGHGGDVWFVEHEGAAVAAVYSLAEMREARP